MNYGQGVKYTCVAAATLPQYAPCTVSGNYAAIGGKDFYGINQDKPISGDHFAAVVKGETKARLATACSVGDIVSVAGSGYLYPVASGTYGVGRIVFQADSGGIACVELFGGPRYDDGT